MRSFRTLILELMELSSFSLLRRRADAPEISLFIALTSCIAAEYSPLSLDFSSVMPAASASASKSSPASLSASVLSTACSAFIASSLPEMLDFMASSLAMRLFASAMLLRAAIMDCLYSSSRDSLTAISAAISDSPLSREAISALSTSYSCFSWS